MAIPRVHSVASVAKNIPGGIVREGIHFCVLYMFLVCMCMCGGQRLTPSLLSCSPPYFSDTISHFSVRLSKGAGQ